MTSAGTLTRCFWEVVKKTKTHSNFTKWYLNFNIVELHPRIRVHRRCVIFERAVFWMRKEGNRQNKGTEIIYAVISEVFPLFDLN